MFARRSLEISKLIYEHTLKRGKNATEILNINFKDKKGKHVLLDMGVDESTLKWLISFKELDLSVCDGVGNNAFHIHGYRLGKLKLLAESPYLSESLRKKMLTDKHQGGETPIEKLMHFGNEYEQCVKVRFISPIYPLLFFLSLPLIFILHVVYAKYALMSSA